MNGLFSTRQWQLSRRRCAWCKNRLQSQRTFFALSVLRCRVLFLAINFNESISHTWKFMLRPSQRIQSYAAEARCVDNTFRIQFKMDFSRFFLFSMRANDDSNYDKTTDPSDQRVLQGCQERRCQRRLTGREWNWNRNWELNLIPYFARVIAAFGSLLEREQSFEFSMQLILNGIIVLISAAEYLVRCHANHPRDNIKYEITIYNFAPL